MINETMNFVQDASGIHGVGKVISMKFCDLEQNFTALASSEVKKYCESELERKTLEF